MRVMNFRRAAVAVTFAIAAVVGVSAPASAAEPSLQQPKSWEYTGNYANLDDCNDLGIAIYHLWGFSFQCKQNTNGNGGWDLWIDR
jgi:hypothetical protein